MTRLLPLGLLLLPLSIPTPAGAQGIPFRSVDGYQVGRASKSVAEGRYAVRSQAALEGAGLHRLLRKGVRVDFKREMVLAVVGRGAGEIVRITRKTVRGRRQLEAQVRAGRTRFTYHVVRLRRMPDRVSWWGRPRNAAPARPTLQAATRRTASGDELRVWRDGRVRLTRGTSTIYGRATRQQLEVLERAAVRASLHRVPPVLSGRSVQLQVEGGRDASVWLVPGREGRYAPQLRPLQAILMAIQRQVVPPRPTFRALSLKRAGRSISLSREGKLTVGRVSGWATKAELGAVARRVRYAELEAGHTTGTFQGQPYSLELSGDEGVGGLPRAGAVERVVSQLEQIARRITSQTRAFRVLQRHIQATAAGRREVRVRVEASGHVHVVPRPGAAGWSLPVEGPATPTELARLQSAVRAAAAHDLPWRMPTQRGAAYRLLVDATELRGRMGSYGPWAARVRPVMSAIDAIVDRLLRAAPTLVEGRVEVAPWPSVRLVGRSGRATTVFPLAFAKTLHKFKGHTVRVAGTVAKSTPPGIQAARLVSPARGELSGTATLLRGEPVFRVHGAVIALFGPGRRVLWRALSGKNSQDVRLSGFLFRDGTGKVTKAYVEGVWARVKRSTRIKTAQGDVPLVSGAEVLITRLWPRKVVEVRASDGSRGQVGLQWLDLGTGARRSSGSSRGLVGGLR